MERLNDMKKTALALFLALGLSSCAVTQRTVMRRCPTVYASLVDFTLTGIAIGLGVLAYNNGEAARTIVLTTGGMGVALSSNLAECRK